MLTFRDRQQKYKAIEQLRKTRILNVRKLATLYDTWAAFARALGQDPAFIAGIAGPNPSRNIGEVLARDIERCLKLPSGYLDTTH